MKTLFSQPAQLIALSDYQEGSVVSRTIINKKTGTVTFFAFDEGQGLGVNILLHLMSGFIFWMGRQKLLFPESLLKVSKGEMLIVPANHPHALKAVKRFKMVLTMVKSK